MKEVIDFFRRLHDNNDRAWFDVHRAEWTHVKGRFAAFTERLIEGIAEFDPAVRGLRVQDCYPAVRPVRELTYLRADVTLEYDNGVPENAAARLTELLGRQELVIQKRTKRKELADVDIAPMIKDFSFTETEGAITGTVTVLAQNPGLNPQLLEKAVARYLPDLTPDFLRVRRRAVLDAEGRDFR